MTSQVDILPGMQNITSAIVTVEWDIDLDP